MNYQEHIKTYDALADEYESRIEKLIPVTKHAIEQFAMYLKPNGSILELGCGVGLATKLFSEKDFKVIGIDLSPKMLRYAKARNPHAAYIEGDFLTTDFDSTFDGIFGFAFIHLFSKDDAQKVLNKIRNLLNTGGFIYLGTTRALESKEGWEVKQDYSGKYLRFRKHWTKLEFTEALISSKLKILKSFVYEDPFGKLWMDFIAKKS